MIANLDQPAPAISPRRQPNLMLHCGAAYVELPEVRHIPTPDPTETWCPIPHHELIHTVQQALQTTHLRIGSQAHSLSHEGLRYFGLMEVQATRSNTDYTWVLGIRNSHDKTFPAGIVAGAQVFVCSNLSFSGEIQFARKHTRYILRDLPQLVSRSIGLLMAKWHHQDKRIAAYKDAGITDTNAHDLIIRATDVGVCSNRLIPSILEEWREPRHTAFEDRSVWSLFNAFTESLKEGNLAELPKRTQALHGLMDTYVGLAA